MPKEQDNNETKNQKAIHLAEACNRLMGQSQDFRYFVEELTEMLLDQRDKNEGLLGELAIVGKGMSLNMKQILQMIDNSSAVLVRARAAEGKRLNGLK